jgi:2,4-dienoyl-CoA reductase-like NADH-dependent reductase (Old Yellow Enzyme family)
MPSLRSAWHSSVFCTPNLLAPWGEDSALNSSDPSLVNTGFAEATTRDEAVALLADSLADAVAVGRAVIANPDLVRR